MKPAYFPHSTITHACALRGYSLVMLLAISAVANAAPLNHIMVIFGENTNYSTAKAQPYLATLASNYAEFTNYHAVTHPSQPNYMALACGAVVVSGDPGCTNVNATNLADLLDQANVNWREYMETMTTPCVDTPGLNGYASKHDYLVNFTDIKTSAARLANIKGFTANNSATYSELLGTNPPAVALCSPNLINDGHNTGVAAFDTWLKPGGGFTFFQDLLSSKYFTDGAIFVTFDETLASTGANQVYCVAVSGLVTPGATSTTNYNHYSLLRTIEDSFNLGTLATNDFTASNMLGLFSIAGIRDWQRFQEATDGAESLY